MNDPVVDWCRGLALEVTRSRACRKNDQDREIYSMTLETVSVESWRPAGDDWPPYPSAPQQSPLPLHRSPTS
jgi:hypothetical protein